ncbi:MAG: biotin synthase BioB, partial [Bacilli bacterium]
MNVFQLADQVIGGQPITPEEALALLHTTDAELLDVVAAANRIRRHHYGNTVKLNMLLNVKSGLCPEDCFYCSQGVESEADIPRYKFMSEQQIVAAAEEAARRSACTLCIVASGTGPTRRELETVTNAVKELRSNTSLKICACLG